MSTRTAINNLPSELLGLIFQFAHTQAVEDLQDAWLANAKNMAVQFAASTRRTSTKQPNDTASRNLALLVHALYSVCTLWKDISTSMSALWAVISLAPRFNLPCTPQRFLELSAGNRITLVMEVNAVNTKHGSLMLRTMDQCDALQRVFCLYLRIATRESYLDFIEHRFSSLEHLHLCAPYFPWAPELEDWAWLGAHSLTLISFDMWSGGGWTIYQYPIPFPRLEQVDVHSVGDYSLRALEAIALVSQEMFFSGLLSTNPTNPVANLRQLCLEGYVDYNVLNGILESSPKLESITILSGALREDIFDGLIRRLHQPSRVLHAPSVRSFRIVGGTLLRTNLQVFVNLCGSISLPNVNTLTLERVRFIQLEDEDYSLPLHVPLCLQVHMIDCL
ncbi:hypothetical protein DACRYDRAFT_106961 [Dacryopinax primogenitus]|uniref:F-box domain-containing protein n=1 Tax=Dacryopinax primogenitus (strain DJM 731) TaxID=1858805 RepID=M5GE11_DACPD|nr:uncharacterized protein DACRYDRAFT_106961 [Dacryopinax primogenitus]EJU02878.1 hypothetical protein DACRYDRAFT_106961 [Dacryopinax primogenitus]